MKKRTGDDWFPFWIDKWLLGSTRDELTIEQCAVWVDFLALSYKDDGYIRANEGIPYPIKRLAGLLNRPEKLIQQTIDRCLEPEVKKLRRESDGTLYVISHSEYELSRRHKKRFDEDAGEKYDFPRGIAKKETINDRLRSLIYASIKNNTHGSKWEKLLGYTLKELMNHIEDNFEENMTWENYGEWHIDHTKPLDSFEYTGFYDKELKIAWHYTNLQPLWATKNLKKSYKDTMSLDKDTKRRVEESRGEESREEEKDPPHLRIKFNFKKKKWQGIIDEDLKRCKKSFPDVDIEYHIFTRMVDWIISNPRKGRKKNFARFINNWLSDEQEKFDLKNAGKRRDEKRAKEWYKEKD